MMALPFCSRVCEPASQSISRLSYLVARVWNAQGVSSIKRLSWIGSTFEMLSRFIVLVNENQCSVSDLGCTPSQELLEVISDA